MALSTIWIYSTPILYYDIMVKHWNYVKCIFDIVYNFFLVIVYFWMLLQCSLQQCKQYCLQCKEYFLQYLITHCYHVKNLVVIVIIIRNHWSLFIIYFFVKLQCCYNIVDLLLRYSDTYRYALSCVCIQ